MRILYPVPFVVTNHFSYIFILGIGLNFLYGSSSSGYEASYHKSTLPSSPNSCLVDREPEFSVEELRTYFKEVAGDTMDVAIGTRICSLLKSGIKNAAAKQSSQQDFTRILGAYLEKEPIMQPKSEKQVATILIVYEKVWPKLTPDERAVIKARSDFFKNTEVLNGALEIVARYELKRRLTEFLKSLDIELETEGFNIQVTERQRMVIWFGSEYLNSKAVGPFREAVRSDSPPVREIESTDMPNLASQTPVFMAGKGLVGGLRPGFRSSFAPRRERARSFDEFCPKTDSESSSNHSSEQKSTSPGCLKSLSPSHVHGSRVKLEPIGVSPCMIFKRMSLDGEPQESSVKDTNTFYSAHSDLVGGNSRYEQYRTSTHQAFKQDILADRQLLVFEEALDWEDVGYIHQIAEKYGQTLRDLSLANVHLALPDVQWARSRFNSQYLSQIRIGALRQLVDRLPLTHEVIHSYMYLLKEAFRDQETNLSDISIVHEDYFFVHKSVEKDEAYLSSLRAQIAEKGKSFRVPEGWDDGVFAKWMRPIQFQKLLDSKKIVLSDRRILIPILIDQSWGEWVLMVVENGLYTECPVSKQMKKVIPTYWVYEPKMHEVGTINSYGVQRILAARYLVGTLVMNEYYRSVNMDGGGSRSSGAPSTEKNIWLRMEMKYPDSREYPQMAPDNFSKNAPGLYVMYYAQMLANNIFPAVRMAEVQSFDEEFRELTDGVYLKEHHFGDVCLCSLMHGIVPDMDDIAWPSNFKK